MDANDPIRRRIVINVDTPGAGGQAYRARGKSRRWPKILAIFLIMIFVVVLVGVVGVFLWWRHFQSTPAYSIAVIIDAAQRNDMATFEKQIDDEKIAQSMINDVRQKAADRYGITLSGTVQKQIDTLVPSIVPRLKDTIHQEVAKEIKELASKSEPKPFILVALAVPTLVTITSEGDKSKAIAPLPNRKIELAMERNGDLWKVTEVKDDVLLERVVDSVMKDLPAIGAAEVGDSLLKALTKPKKRK